MSSAPVPSRRCLLSDLANRAVGEKVRLLGCVTSYATASATLCLQDPHPRGSKDHVLVDVKLLLETLKTENTQIGEWVNVIGYIVASPVRPDTTPANRKRSEVHIQALLLWSAGPLDLDRYEASLEALDDEDEAPNG